MRDAYARAGRELAGSGEADWLPLARGLLSWGEAQWRAAPPETPVLLSDPEVSAVSVCDCGEPLTALGEPFGPSGALVRASVARRLVLAREELLRGAGLVNYPTEWWHWSYGDRYWAVMTGAPAALYGPVAAGRVAR